MPTRRELIVGTSALLAAGCTTIRPLGQQQFVRAAGTRFTNDGVRYPVCAGLAENYIGYIVPMYNFVLATSGAWLNEAEGDHYEEVYALSTLVEQHAIHPILQLLQYRK